MFQIPLPFPLIIALAVFASVVLAQESPTSLPGDPPERDEAAREAARERALARFQHEDNLVYKVVTNPDGQEEKLEYIFFPPNPKFEKAPMVLYTHGGGWGNLDRYVILWPNSIKALRQLLDAGIAVAAINYRLTRPGISTVFDCVVDCKDAARYFTANAEKHGIDPARIATWGSSAGGHLALMTALAPNDAFPGDPSLASVNPSFRAVCAWFPATTFVNLDTLRGSNFDLPQRWLPMLGGPYAENLPLAELLSPTEHLKPDTIPILLIHGDQDEVLPVASSQFMLEEAKRIGAANVELLVVEGAGHGFADRGINPSLDEVQRITADFLIKHLTEGL